MAKRSLTLPLLFFSIALAGILAFSVTAALLPPKIGLGLTLGISIVILSLVSPEAALYLLIFSMLLSPELGVGGGGREDFLEKDRPTTLRLDDLLLVIVGFTWLARTAIYKDLGLFLRSPLNRPIALYMLACFFSTGVGILWGRVPLKSGFFFTLKYLEYFIVYFMVINHLETRTQVKRWTVALLATCTLVSLVGIAQIPAGGRVIAPFEGETGEPNTLGGYLVLMLSLVAGLILTSPSWKTRLLLGGLAGWISLPLLATLSRASYLATIPIYLSLLLFSERRKGLLLGLALALLVGPFLLPSNVKDRVTFTFSQPLEAGQVRLGKLRLDTSTSDRLKSWKAVFLQDWFRHPILGWGVTGYRFLDAQYPRILAETGIVGLGAFGWLIYALFARFHQTYRRTTDPLFKGLSLGLLAGLVALLTHAIGSNTFIIVRIMEPFWFLAGMGVRLLEIEGAADR